MKKRFLFLTISSFGLLTPFFLVTTSCKGDEEPIEKEYNDFISDRTFSICKFQREGSNQYSVARGTGWIINKDTSPGSNYKYYIATNFHVELGFRGMSNQIKYSDNEHLDSIFRTSDYENFVSCTNKYSDSYYSYDGDLKHGIDFWIYDVDFGIPTGEYKEKLDRLNGFYAIHSHINDFAVDYNQGSNLYIGGYPVPDKQNSAAEWESHKISSFEHEPKNSGYEHGVDDDNINTATIIDISPQYVLPQKKNTWMTHGASGSMIINSQKQICGIYWGGFLPNKNSKHFIPCASIFNSSNKNFIEDIE